ncbi:MULTISPECIES: G/U mismatch-specific DNA glycosylase [Neobacillus]|uniref:G/U mismatch-specific DNA glycosylase n=1 Tax=Neobacillus rhizophilus TaxID=2833579 RepID=A0A942U9S0_9BACI|nr:MULTISPECIES: G/U mismatch-specific DNA glycosylase [Neobacillus]MBS4216140.1 G/U mismatch-specific DNA glycosylase [Neobacillus rhizophilus]MBU8919867.1 G/U mismatch-specific DNA glycosylase [Bacillus sp. FJAT-29953]
MKPVKDRIKENLAVLFVGFNPGVRSSETGHHFAGPSNRFWKILHEAGLTQRKLDPSEGDLLLELGMGITNIVARPTKAAAEITKEEFKEGREILKQKIERLKPQIVCYVGKGVYLEYSGLKTAPWGIQEEAIVPGTVDFVAPNTSGLVRMKLDEMVEIYRELVRLVVK